MMLRPEARAPTSEGPVQMDGAFVSARERSDLVEGCGSRDVGQLLGLVVDGDRHLAELVLVLTRMVSAEQELGLSGQLDADVGLGATTIATIRCGQTC